MCSVCPVWPPAAAGERADDVPKAFKMDDEKRDMEGMKITLIELQDVLGRSKDEFCGVSETDFLMEHLREDSHGKVSRKVCSPINSRSCGRR